jgi:hydroxycarboxylate dehydrogenase B
MTVASPAGEISPVLVSKQELAILSRELLKQAGATPGNATVVVDHLLEADAMGLVSHGVMRVPQYLGEIAAGEIAPAAAPVVSSEAPGRLAVDGQKSFGQVVGARMAAEAVRVAKDNGTCFVVGRHMGHTGRIGAYAEAMAREGCVGIAVCSGPRAGHWVAPFGGREGRLATNPIAFAYPVADGPPVAADFSTSVVPEGVARSLLHRGMKTPEGAIRDAAGNLTDDPAALYAEPRGFIQPLGGVMGYRGTALALLVEVLAALLARDDTDDPNREGSNLAMLALAVDEGFPERAARAGAYIRSAPPLDAGRRVMLPGEREQRNLAVSGDTATVDRTTWTAIVAAAGDRFTVPDPIDG